MQTAFQIEQEDHVATALQALKPGAVTLLGNAVQTTVTALAEIPDGHKIALRDIACGERILKYKVVIGRATQPIAKGEWVHLHNLQSVYDERSSHLDAVTGAPLDTEYR